MKVRSVCEIAVVFQSTFPVVYPNGSRTLLYDLKNEFRIVRSQEFPHVYMAYDGELLCFFFTVELGTVAGEESCMDM